MTFLYLLFCVIGARIAWAQQELIDCFSDTRCAQNDCDVNTGVCNQGCDTGWWGQKCDQRCRNTCPNDCDAVTGDCIQCNSRAWNLPLCDRTCGAGCAYSSSNEFTLPNDRTSSGYCSQVDGSCPNCLDSWWGVNCVNECHAQCASSSLIGDRKCDLATGDCAECTADYYGLPTCATRCSTGCRLGGGNNGRSCDESTGSCYACDDNRWSSTAANICDRTCAAGCKEGVDPVGSRNCNATGACFECDEWHWNSPACDQPCSPNCAVPESSFAEERMCDENTGSCTHCQFFRWGDDCDQVCPNHCPLKVDLLNGGDDLRTLVISSGTSSPFQTRVTETCHRTAGDCSTFDCDAPSRLDADNTEKCGCGPNEYLLELDPGTAVGIEDSETAVCIPCPPGTEQQPSKLTGFNKATVCTCSGIAVVHGRHEPGSTPLETFRVTPVQGRLAYLPSLNTSESAQCSCSELSYRRLGSDDCTDCGDNMFRPQGAFDTCVCDPGSYWAYDGTTFSDQLALNNLSPGCELCPEGHYCPGFNLEPAIPCDENTFQPYSGRSSCVVCINGTDAETAFTALNCPVGSIIPQAREDLCPGGAPQTCNPVYNRRPESIACTQCRPDYFFKLGVCEPCPPGKELIIVLAGIAVLLIITFFAWCGEKVQDRGTFLSFVVNIQVLSVFAMFNIEWPKFLRDFFSMFLFFSFDIDVAGPDCLIEWTEHLKWLFLTGTPLAFVFVSLIFSCYLNKIKLNTFHKRDRKNQSKWTKRFKTGLRVVWQMFQLAYIGIAVRVISGFRCTAPIGGTIATLVKYPSIECNSTEHQSIIVVSSVSIVLMLIFVPCWWFYNVSSIQSDNKTKGLINQRHGTMAGSVIGSSSGGSKKPSERARSKTKPDPAGGSGTLRRAAGTLRHAHVGVNVDDVDSEFVFLVNPFINEKTSSDDLRWCIGGRKRWSSYWNFFLLFKRLALVLIADLTPSRQGEDQSIGALILLGISFLMHLLMLPFLSPAINYLEIFNTLMAVLISLFGYLTTQRLISDTVADIIGYAILVMTILSFLITAFVWWRIQGKKMLENLKSAKRWVKRKICCCCSDDWDDEDDDDGKRGSGIYGHEDDDDDDLLGYEMSDVAGKRASSQVSATTALAVCLLLSFPLMCAGQATGGAAPDCSSWPAIKQLSKSFQVMGHQERFYFPRAVLQSGYSQGNSYSSSSSAQTLQVALSTNVDRCKNSLLLCVKDTGPGSCPSLQSFDMMAYVELSQSNEPAALQKMGVAPVVYNQLGFTDPVCTLVLPGRLGGTACKLAVCYGDESTDCLVGPDRLVTTNRCDENNQYFDYELERCAATDSFISAGSDVPAGPAPSEAALDNLAMIIGMSTSGAMVLLCCTCCCCLICYLRRQQKKTPEQRRASSAVQMSMPAIDSGLEVAEAVVVDKKGKKGKNRNSTMSSSSQKPPSTPSGTMDLSSSNHSNYEMSSTASNSGTMNLEGYRTAGTQPIQSQPVMSTPVQSSQPVMSTPVQSSQPVQSSRPVQSSQPAMAYAVPIG